ncbi:MAG TPA: patatin-like phospholipase family protein [Alloacidobacterium sp.]|nr:patatin-like phospholipase family protein [Alloacidobacterium sp.]
MALYDLVFEGGGAKGMAFAGALQVFGNAGHAHRRLVGTSAGAITAMLTGAGYSAAELTVESTKTDAAGNPVFASFMDPPAESDFTQEMIDDSETISLMKQAGFPFSGMLKNVEEQILKALLHLELYRELFSFNECGGFYAGDAALNWFRQRLVAKGLAADITWADFAKKTGSDVSVVTTDVTDKESVVLNARTAPNVPVAESVRMSMSIPFVWREMIWQPEWGTYNVLGTNGQVTERIKAGNIFVDGGVLSNFPLRLIAESTPDVVAVMGPTDPKGAGNLGLYLDSTVMVPGAEVSDTRRPRLRAADRVTQLIDTLTDSSDLAVMREYESAVCRLPVGGYGTTEFRMSSARQQLLIGSGATAMKKYLGIA